MPYKKGDPIPKWVDYRRADGKIDLESYYHDRRRWVRETGPKKMDLDKGMGLTALPQATRNMHLGEGVWS